MVCRDVVTLKVGVPEFVLLNAMSAGEPTATLGRRGEHGQSVGRRHRDEHRAQRRAVADGIGDRRRERRRRAGLIGGGSPGEGLRRRVEGHAGGQRARRDGHRIAAGGIGLHRVGVDLAHGGRRGGRRSHDEMGVERGRGRGRAADIAGRVGQA